MTSRPPAPGCAPGQLTVTAERVDGAGGQQFATVFVTATTTCRLRGAPAVALTDGHGRVLVRANGTRSSASVLTARPGHRVSALVHGTSTCNAPVSVSMQIATSASGPSTTVAMQLRACPLVVDFYK